jgi:hypothetical protein
LAFSHPNKQLCVITCGDDKTIKVHSSMLFIESSHFFCARMHSVFGMQYQVTLIICMVLHTYDKRLAREFLSASDHGSCFTFCRSGMLQQGGSNTLLKDMKHLCTQFVLITRRVSRWDVVLDVDTHRILFSCIVISASLAILDRK